jgi:hypothetical protein
VPVGQLPTPVSADPTAGLSVEYSTRALAVDAGQTATIDLTIINGSYRSLLFQVAVEGIDPTWVTVTPSQLEVPNRQRGTVTLAFSLPSGNGVRAGAQTAQVTVTTPTYPDWKSQSRLALTINPYSDFLVSGLKPRVQSLYSNQPYVQTTFEVTNRGNNDSAFRLTGEDERFNLRCEFKLPNDTLYQPRQAELRLPPGETGKVTIRVTPITRRNIGIGARHHYFTINVAPQSGGHLPRALLGEVREQPLVGTLAIGLIAIVLLALIAFAMRPSIGTFTASPTEISAGDSVTLTWSASPLSSLRISPDVGNVIGPDGRRGSALPGSAPPARCAFWSILYYPPSFLPLTMKPLMRVTRSFFPGR